MLQKQIPLVYNCALKIVELVTTLNKEVEKPLHFDIVSLKHFGL